jgi:cytochrome c peroxidase
MHAPQGRYGQDCFGQGKINYVKKTIIIAVAVLSVAFMRATVGEEPANEAQLGKLLFSDPVLSKDRTISCASCHIPEFAFADTSATSKGVGGIKGDRNTPSAMNVVLHDFFFWDGRAKTLEEQALAPIENPKEMNLSLDEAISRLRNSKKYSGYFKKIYNEEPNRNNLAKAIAAFERTLETSESPFDNWKFYDKPDAVSESARRGFEIFNTKGKCIECHFGANLALNQFRNIGLFDGKKLNDSGRAVISGDPLDIGRFKVAPLRNVAVTAPYMHNGMFKTLQEVIEFYNDPDKIVPRSINRDSVLLKPLGLTEIEKADLEEFLRSLTDKQFEKIAKQ